jgi:hypothetical protein
LLTTALCLSVVGDLLGWLARSRSKLTDLDEPMVERYLRHRAPRQSIQPGDRAALKRLLSVLRGAGLIGTATLPPITPNEQIFEEFADYLRRERGLAPKSVIRHLPIIRRFLREVCPAGDLGKIGQKDVTRYTLKIRARGPGRRCAGRCANSSGTSISEG